MADLFVKFLVCLRIDTVFAKVAGCLERAKLLRLERKCGCKIRTCGQGYHEPRIISATGDYSGFYIHPTSHLKSDSILECSGGINIGRFFHTGRGLVIYSTNHNYESMESIPYDSRMIIEPVTIKDFVWCGANVTIVPGVIIGEGAVIGAGAVVTKNVPDCAVMGGNPAKVIKYRDIETFNELKNKKKWC